VPSDRATDRIEYYVPGYSTTTPQKALVLVVEERSVQSTSSKILFVQKLMTVLNESIRGYASSQLWTLTSWNVAKI